MPRPWQFTSHDTGLVRQMSAQMRCSSLLAQVLLSRGFKDAQEANGFLAGNLKDLQEPESLPGVPAAVEVILKALKDKRRITIYGDYDVDGMTSTAILHECLQLIGAHVDYYIPCRLEEGYGLNCDAIRELHQADPQRLVITVDCGICSVAEAQLARELDLDLIITDHHQYGEELPDALALVHPRLPGAEPGFPEFCGAGVAFKLAWAICKEVSDGHRVSENMRNFLKTAAGLAMIGTVADVVPLVGENRLIVKYGLETLFKQAGSGLKALMSVAGILDKSSLSAEDIAFGLSPRLNAAGRLGQARLAVELLTTNQADRAAQLADYLDGLNKQRQAVERKILKQAKELVAENVSWNEDPVLVLAHHEWHPGVIGIVASRIAEHFEKPAILITFAGNHSLGQGSGRTYGPYNLHAAVTLCQEHLEKFGGHPAAIGLKVQPSQVDAFRSALNQISLEEHPVREQTPRRIDSEIALTELSVGAIQELEKLGPFGCQNERPIFVSTGLQLAEPPRTMGEGGRHLSLRVKQYGQTMRAIAFGRGEWAEKIEQEQGSLALCFKPIINEFRGRMNVELQLIDWKTDQEILQHTGEASANLQTEP